MRAVGFASFLVVCAYLVLAELEGQLSVPFEDGVVDPLISSPKMKPEVLDIELVDIFGSSDNSEAKTDLSTGDLLNLEDLDLVEMKESSQVKMGSQVAPSHESIVAGKGKYLCYKTGAVDALLSADQTHSVEGIHYVECDKHAVCDSSAPICACKAGFTGDGSTCTCKSSHQTKPMHYNSTSATLKTKYTL